MNNNAGNVNRCLNCGTELTDNFCPHCGQKAKTKRLKLKEIIGDTVNSFIGGDSKLLNSVTALCIRPGHMIREYLQGHRARYYNPMQMLIWMISIYAVLSFLVGNDIFFANNTSPQDHDTLKKGSILANLWIYVEKIYTYITENKLYYMVFTAVLGVWPTYFIFRKNKILRPDGESICLNHTEIFYVLLYSACIEIICSIVLIPFTLIKGAEDILTTINNAAGFMFDVIIMKQLYEIGWWKSFIRNVLAAALILAYIIILIILGAGLVYGIVCMIYGKEAITG